MAENKMNIEHPIICPHCNKDTGWTQEQFMHCVLTDDLLCPHCGKVVIAVNPIIFSYQK